MENKRTESQAINDTIKESGYKKSYISDKLGIYRKSEKYNTGFWMLYNFKSA